MKVQFFRETLRALFNKDFCAGSIVDFRTGPQWSMEIASTPEGGLVFRTGPPEFLEIPCTKEGIDSMVGLRVLDGYGGLVMSHLSSGEKHLIVLICTMLFEAPENSLVLIDEPELSLHVYWQRQFLRIVEEIIALNPIDVLIATHSPQIVHDRRDLAIGLGPVE